MNQDRLSLIEEWPCLPDTSTRFEQLFALVTDTDVHTEVIILSEIIDDLIGEMMHVHYNASETGILQLKDDTFEQRFSTDTYQCLRNTVGKWLKASAQTCCEYHCLHHCCIAIF